MKTKTARTMNIHRPVSDADRAVKRTLTVWALFLIVLAIPLAAQAARERYVLEFDDAHIRGHRGEPATIFLKKAFHEQYPWVDVSDLDLHRVVLVAKSKNGWGVAQLRVGEWVTDSYEVGGRPVDFRDGRRITFDRIQFDNPSCRGRGPWQIDLQGNFIVRKVVLEVENHRWRRHHYSKRPPFWRGHYR